MTNFLKLVSKYAVTPQMSEQEIFDAFVAVENSERTEFDRRRLEAPTEPKKLYWSLRASGLTTRGGRTQLNTLLHAARLIHKDTK